MRARLVRIGNSRGVRLPKPLIKEAGLEEEVDIRVKKGEVIIRPARKPRADWEEAAALAHERREDGLIVPDVPNLFDETEWEW